MSNRFLVGIAGFLSISAGAFCSPALAQGTILDYEVPPAPDSFFYSHAFRMFQSEAFNRTGYLGHYYAGDLTVYGGWTLGWDNGFNLNDTTGTIFYGEASGSIPLYDANSWAARYQANVFAQGFNSPLNNQSNVTIGASGTAYLQSISSNAIGINAGIAQTEDLRDFHWLGLGTQFSVNQFTKRTDFNVGEIEYQQGNWKQDFYSVDTNIRYYLLEDQLAVGLLGTIGKLDGWAAKDFRQVGVEVLYNPPQFDHTTVWGGFRHTVIDFEQPLANDISYNTFVVGARFSFNPVEENHGMETSLRDQELFLSPFDVSPVLVRYDY